MAGRKTSDIIKVLQDAVDTYGDLPFEITDGDLDATYSNVTVYVNTEKNGGAVDKDSERIGIIF